MLKAYNKKKAHGSGSQRKLAAPNTSVPTEAMPLMI